MVVLLIIFCLRGLMVSCVGGHICVDSPSKQGKETTLDQSESVNYFNPGKQDELMETCNAAEMVLLLWMRMMPRARLQEGVTGSRNTALRPERLILSFPYLRAPLAAEDVGNILKFSQISYRSLGIDNMKLLPKHMHTCTTLQKLSTWDLPNLVSFGERDCEKLRPSVEKWGLQRLVSLRRFQISSKDVLKTLLKEQLLLTALHTLAISYLSSLKSLDRNGLQHLTSLQKLYIGRCDSLDFLPKQGFLASISFLNITRCPSVKKRYENKKGKEWRKIAHIPCMKIDDEDNIIQKQHVFA
ncbi:hypothetical protein DVH24_013573 [Malus domestica]|uniref:Uncharacterized protein n=1 Tax=Malus domestica TaxID=3750 RepID=A0A498JDU6_MALDO|nr:hypothetical protein DVH24_013573 [Malus domestica]